VTVKLNCSLGKVTVHADTLIDLSLSRIHTSQVLWYPTACGNITLQFLFHSCI